MMTTFKGNTCRSRIATVDTTVDPTYRADNIDVGCATSNDPTSTVSNGSGVSSMIKRKDYILRLSVDPFALLPSLIFSMTRYNRKFILPPQRYIKIADDSDNNEMIEYRRIDDFNCDDNDAIDATLSIWKERLLNFIKNDSTVKAMKRDNMTSFGVVLSTLSLWCIAFVTLFDMMQGSDGWTHGSRLLYICKSFILLCVVVKWYALKRQPSSTFQEMDQKRLLVRFVVGFMVADHVIWLTSYIVDMMHRQTDGTKVVIPVVLCSVLFTLFIVGVFLQWVCDINCFRDKTKRQEVLQRVCDEINAMNHDLTNLKCHPIIRSYHSDVSVYVFAKNMA